LTFIKSLSWQISGKKEDLRKFICLQKHIIVHIK